MRGSLQSSELGVFIYTQEYHQIQENLSQMTEDSLKKDGLVTLNMVANEDLVFGVRGETKLENTKLHKHLHFP